MNLIYNRNNQLNISQIIDGYEIPQRYRATACKLYAYIYPYISEHRSDSIKQKKLWVKGINILTYLMFAEDDLPVDWDSRWPFDNLPDIDDDDLKSVLKQHYLTIDAIVWDINDDPHASNNQNNAEITNESKHVVTSSTINRLLSKYREQQNTHKQNAGGSDLKVQKSEQVNMQTANKLTRLADVMLDPGYPYFPKVDLQNMWLLKKVQIGNIVEEYGIPRSLPLIPERQSDITATTEVNTMIDSDFMKLFPNHIMKLRSSAMYQTYPEYTSLEYDEDLGVIFPIAGFTREQVIDNIIKYPDIINIGLGRLGKRARFKYDDKPETVWEEFYKRLEVEGQLKLITASVWDETPELKILPPNVGFQQEYVVRKYLLEKDNNIPHEKEAFGETYPFITLFMPPEEYIKRGYKDVVEIARKCVKSRVFYFRSRNSMLTKLGLKFNYEGELISE